jgi:NAD(P)-dependent dehydrogenase (short-subunit alcohol dehydrogenase family)
MDTGLKGRTVLITGASRNMGRHAALAFAREGANLALCTSQKMQELEQVGEEARALGAKVVTRRCDVTDEAAVARFVAATRDALGTVHVAINLAGYRAERPLLEESVEAWTRTIAVNLTGPFHVCRAVLPLMKAQRFGRIINVSGVAPYLGMGAAKAAVKLGIVGFTRGVAKEFAEHGITANCVGPGQIGRDTEDRADRLSHNPAPMRRKGTPDEAVSILLYLASEQAGFITGQCYLMNGGMYFQ